MRSLFIALTMLLSFNASAAYYTLNGCYAKLGEAVTAYMNDQWRQCYNGECSILSYDSASGTAIVRSTDGFQHAAPVASCSTPNAQMPSGSAITPGYAPDTQGTGGTTGGSTGGSTGSTTLPAALTLDDWVNMGFTPQAVSLVMSLCLTLIVGFWKMGVLYAWVKEAIARA